MTDTLLALLKALEAGDYSAFPLLLDHLEETEHRELRNVRAIYSNEMRSLTWRVIARLVVRDARYANGAPTILELKQLLERGAVKP